MPTEIPLEKNDIRKCKLQKNPDGLNLSKYLVFAPSKRIYSKIDIILDLVFIKNILKSQHQ